MIGFAPLLRFDYARWTSMHGGNRTRFDPRPVLKSLESDSEEELLDIEFRS